MSLLLLKILSQKMKLHIKLNKYLLIKIYFIKNIASETYKLKNKQFCMYYKIIYYLIIVILIS